AARHPAHRAARGRRRRPGHRGLAARRGLAAPGRTGPAAGRAGRAALLRRLHRAGSGRGARHLGAHAAPAVAECHGLLAAGAAGLTGSGRGLRPPGMPRPQIDPQLWPEVSRRFDEALELPATELAAWLMGLPAAVANAVERLLAADASTREPLAASESL